MRRPVRPTVFVPRPAPLTRAPDPAPLPTPYTVVGVGADCVHVSLTCVACGARLYLPLPLGDVVAGTRCACAQCQAPCALVAGHLPA